MTTGNSKDKPALWNVKVFTLFPEMFPGQLGFSLAGKALESGIWSYEAINIRDYAKDKHKMVDDTPYGGGAGMVMRADVLGDAIADNIRPGDRIIYPSPRGKVFNQKMANELAQESNLAIICGRFEGVDERVLEEYQVEEVSLGDFVLSGGETAALAVMDSCIRLLPDVIGNCETLNEESFGENADYTGLLEYPLYTRPHEWNGRAVPDVLMSGNHGKIRQWRLERAEQITRLRRSDLWKEYKKRF